jgi:hypothetical protein
MKLCGEIEIFGAVRIATVVLNDDRRQRRGKGVTFIERIGKYKAYGYDESKPKFYGYYDDEAEAIEAATVRRNLARERKRPGARRNARPELGRGVTFIPGPDVWRVQLTLQGKRVSLGRYLTYGHAILARDVVARRCGKHVVVEDYEMPLGLVTETVVRSYITDRIFPPTPDEIAEYQRRVDALNGNINKPVAPPLDRLSALPPEIWRTQQPNRNER